MSRTFKQKMLEEYLAVQKKADDTKSAGEAIMDGISKKQKQIELAAELGQYQEENREQTQTPVLQEYQKAADTMLAKSKEQALQKANVAYETAKKYLPVQNKANGLSGLGVSETAGIDAYNKHIANLGDIELKYAELEETKENEHYREAMTMMQSGAFNSAADLDTYLATVRGNVSDAQMGQLEYYANFIKNNPDQKAIWEEDRNEEIRDRAMDLMLKAQRGGVEALTEDELKWMISNRDLINQIFATSTT